MLSSRLASALAARHIHYGWVVAGITFFTMLSTAAAMGAAGVLIVPLEREFGWSDTEISSALAVRFLLFAIISPFTAALMNYFGLRRVILTALALIAAGALASMAMREVWQLVLLWGVVMGAGVGLTALVLGATVATRWFEKRRGLVVGLMTASNATGQLVFQPLLANISQNLGWRPAVALGVGVLAVAFGLVALFIRDRPVDLGLTAFGGTGARAPRPPRGKLTDLVMAPLLALQEASRNSVFWVLALTFFVCGLSTTGLVQQHWISICTDYGIAPIGAAGLLAVIGVFDFFGTIFSGWLSDRYDNRWLLFWYYGLRGLSLLYLPLSGFSLLLLTPFAVFYGLDWVATVPPTVRLTADRFGAERAPLVFGWVFAAHQVGAATAAFLAGATRTGFASYMPFIVVAGVFCLLAAGLVMTIEGRRTPRAAPLAAA